MKEEIKEKFPKWVQENAKENPLILGDDIDSLMCYQLQKELFNREIKYFYDVNYKCNKQAIFKEIDYVKASRPIAIDLAIEKGRTWDNHVVRYSSDDSYNKNSANLNAIFNINNENYGKKWCVSTYITMLSYYNIDITKWTRQQLAILCAIDGLYTPFLDTNKSFRPIALEHLQKLEYGFLSRFIQGNIKYIQRIERQLNLEKLSKIFKTEITLPKVQFKVAKEYIKKSFEMNGNSKDDLKETCNYNFINFALTFKNNVMCSI